MLSAESVRLMRERSSGSDLLILRVCRTGAREIAIYVAVAKTAAHRIGEAHDARAAAVRAADRRGRAKERRLRRGGVGSACESECELEVLRLVVADRHVRRVKEQNVGRHQDRVREQRQRRGQRVARAHTLVFELRHALQSAERRVARQQPVQFAVRCRCAAAAVSGERRAVRPRPQRAAGHAPLTSDWR